jgi:hypothetical protein
MDEYQRLIAERAGAQKRKRMIFGVVLVVALGAGGYWWKQQKDKAAGAQRILDAAGRFAEKDKTEMGAFWSCTFGSDIDVGMLSSAQQIQQKIEGAYFTQQKTFSDHLTNECVPKLESARGAMGGLGVEMAPELKPALDKYVGALPRMQTGLEVYADKIKSRGATKDVDTSMQEVGAAFTADVTPQSVAFEKFLVCAIPDLGKKKDTQEVLQYLFETCKKGDPVAFMGRVREQCGPLVQNVDANAKPSPSKTFKATVKKLADAPERLGDAFADCAKWSRKGKKALDLEDFLNAAGDYMEARGELVQTARETAAKIQGTPMPQAKKAAAGAGAE